MISPLSRRHALGLIGGAAALLLMPRSLLAQASLAPITVSKDPNCGCCNGWVAHLRNAGFAVTVVDSSDLPAIKTRLGVPADLASCHTAEVGGYVIEGHVPADAVARLLREAPRAKGLTVPGMPVGSLGRKAASPRSTR